MSSSYDKNNDFVHHKDLTEEESKDFLSEFPSSLCEVSFIFDPYLKEDFSNKSSYQIFRLFSSLLKEKAKVLKVQKMLLGNEINHRAELLTGLTIRIYGPKRAPNDRFNYKECRLNKLSTEKTPLDKFLENSTEIKNSLAFLNSKNEDVLTIREELYEKDILFFHNVIDMLKLLLQKPQEFLFKSGGYKPNRIFPQKNKKKNPQKKDKIDNLYIFCTMLLDLSSESNLEQQSLKPFLEELLSLRILNLKWENPENPLPSRYRYPSSNQDFIEIDPENFTFGLFDSEVTEPFFSPVWDLANLDNSKSDIRMKKFLIRLDKKSQEIQEISLFFLVRKREKTPEKDESRRFLIKIKLKPPSKVVVQRKEGAIEFFLEQGREFPKCYFSEVRDSSFKNLQIKRSFHRIHNFLIDFKEIDEFLLSYLRFKGGFSVIFTHSQTQCIEFKQFCQILDKNQIVIAYFRLENPVRILEFIKIKPELTKSQFLNIKYLDFTTKYLLLVLDSMDKLKLSLQALHELEKLREFNPKSLELGLTDIAKSNSEVIDLSIDDVVKRLEISMKMGIPDPNSCYNIMNVRKVLITTSGLFTYFLPEPVIEIGELSRYRKDYKLFLLAGFCDEDFTPLSHQKLLLWGFYHDFLQSELMILERPYDFLGFSAKMSQKSLFLLLARKKKLNANKILDNLFGNVSVLQEQVVYDPYCPLHYKNLIYFCQRMNNCLTQGLTLEDCLTKSLDLAYSELTQDVKIVISCKTEEDLCPNEISKGILQNLSERFHREISCLQVNFFGIRIKLVASNHLPEQTIKVSRHIYETVFNEVFFLRMNQPLRFAELGEGQGLYFDSQQSFKGAKLQILDFSEVKLGYLNQNLIILLEYLEKSGQMEVSGYPDISNLLLKSLKKLLEQLLAGNIDVNLLKDFDQLDLDATVLHESEDFFNFPVYFKNFLENKERDARFLNDVFWRMLNDTTFLAILSRLENKLEFSPFKNFYSLLYIEDPLGILKGNEAYLLISRNQLKENLTGKSLVFREFAVDFCEFRTITLVSNPSYSSYPNVLILSHDLMKEMASLFPVPYSLPDRLMLINDPALSFPQDIIPKSETQNDLEDTNKLIFKRLLERPKDTFVRLSNVANFFLNCVQEHSRKKSAYVQCILSNFSRNSKLFVATKEFGNKQWFLEYLNSLFADYLCQFELKKEQKAEKQLPDFMRGWIEEQENTNHFLPSVNIAGTLYREVVQVREKLVRKLHKGVTYEFKQTHFEESFVMALEDSEVVKDVLGILAAYYREIGFLIEDLGACNESEIFLGVLIERSRFRQKKHLEKFKVLSQVGLANLFRKMTQSYREKFLDFEENKIKYAKYTYTVSYYFAGCFLKEANAEILTLLEDFDKEKRVFLGLTWLLFSNTLTEIKGKKENPQKTSRV